MNTFRLGNVCEKIGSGATPRGGKESYHSFGIALIRSQNIYNDGFKRDGLAFINEIQAAELANVTIQEGDVLLNLTGDSVARVCQVPREILPARVNQHVAIIRPRNEILNARFLHYYLASAIMQQYLLGLASVGATRNALTKGMIEGLEIPALPLPEQDTIAAILGSLDDKIELNRRMNETLEAMSRALFKSWFVDFDPVRAKAEGWRNGKVEEIASLSRDTVNPGNFPNEVFDHYSIPAFDEKQLPNAETGDQIKSNKFIVTDDAVLISKLNPRIPRVWLPAVGKARRSICSTEFLVASPKTGCTREYLYALFSSDVFLNDFATLVTGTSGSHQRVKAEFLTEMETLIPSKSTITEFTEHAKPLYERTQKNIEQSRTLATTRDALLPKLMSGEIRVRGDTP